MACIKDVKAAQTLGIHRIILETYALMVTQALKTADFRLSAMGGLVHELKELLAGEFSDAQVSFTPAFAIE